MVKILHFNQYLTNLLCFCLTRKFCFSFYKDAQSDWSLMMIYLRVQSRMQAAHTMLELQSAKLLLLNTPVYSPFKLANITLKARLIFSTCLQSYTWVISNTDIPYQVRFIMSRNVWPQYSRHSKCSCSWFLMMVEADCYEEQIKLPINRNELHTASVRQQEVHTNVKMEIIFIIINSFD